MEVNYFFTKYEPFVRKTQILGTVQNFGLFSTGNRKMGHLTEIVQLFVPKYFKIGSKHSNKWQTKTSSTEKSF